MLDVSFWFYVMLSLCRGEYECYTAYDLTAYVERQRV